MSRLWPVPQPISRMRASAGQRDLALDQVGQDVAPGAVPPVALVELGHPVVDDALHQPNTQWRLSAKVTRGVTNSIGSTGHQVGPSSMRLGQHADEQGVEAEADQRDDEEAAGALRRIVAAAMAAEADPAVQDIAERHRHQIAEQVGEQWRDAELGRRRRNRRRRRAPVTNPPTMPNRINCPTIAVRSARSPRLPSLSPACPLADSD